MAKVQEETLAMRLFRAFPTMHGPNDWVYHEPSGDHMVPLLQQAVELVKKALKAYETHLSIDDEDFILLHLCRAHNGVREGSSKREWDIATILSIQTFLEWSIEQVQGEKGLSQKLFQNFLLDLSGFRLCPELMLREGMSRMGSPMGMFHFSTMVQHLFWGKPLFDLSSELFCIFGLRQALESAFFRMVGFFDTIPRMKFSAQQMLDILVEHEQEMIFSPLKKVKLKRLGTLCQWANRSVHSMYTASTWTIWMAFGASEFLFDNTYHKRNLSTQTLYSVTIPEATFQKIREELTQKLQKNASAQKATKKKAFANVNTFTIRWDSPEANIEDSTGKFLSLQGKNCIFPLR